MAIAGWCGEKCGESDKCSHCYLDMNIPCSPDCENLTVDGKIHITKCLMSGCEEIWYIFDMVGASEEEIVKAYGDVAEYPYMGSF